MVVLPPELFEFTEMQIFGHNVKQTYPGVYKFSLKPASCHHLPYLIPFPSIAFLTSENRNTFLIDIRFPSLGIMLSGDNRGTI